MVLTAAQTTAFFEDANQMALPNETVVQLVNEGINDVDDLAEFQKEDIVNLAYGNSMFFVSNRDKN
eukprot:CAMPEP_0178922402 /NCGR_PEP_ID=MMETSP0786-20121207/16132_1 /TAXON_ID=186022 /ORGANISM="Thalassionema frauenfeldii, Strain CCMP 1798" /LENGTH=65 /DNA_ID=CAMNT_0020596759 /DNA_START=57 /DNA_END=254 /DNA_ORIENTATION=-